MRRCFSAAILALATASCAASAPPAAGADLGGTSADGTGATESWLRAWGSAADDGAEGVAVDGQGNIYLCGWFSGALDLGAGAVTPRGPKDAFLLSVDSFGRFRWVRHFGGVGDDRCMALTIDRAGRLHAAGFFFESMALDSETTLTSAGAADGWIASWDGQGQLLAASRHGGPENDYAAAIASWSDQRVAVSGWFSGTAEFGGSPLSSAGESDIFAASYDSEGAYRWAARIGGAGDDKSWGVAIDQGGRVLVSAYFSGRVLTEQGDLVSRGDRDALIAVYGPEGTMAWRESCGGSGDDRGTRVTTDGAGNIYWLARFEGDASHRGEVFRARGATDALLLSYGPDGSSRWSRAFGGSGPDAAWAVGVDLANRVYIGGAFAGNVSFMGESLQAAGGVDLFLLGLDGAGSIGWQVTGGSRGEDSANALVLDDESERVLVVGGYGGAALKIGAEKQPNAGAQDFFLLARPLR